VKLWDVQTRKELPLPGCDRFEVLVYSVAFSPDGHTFATGAHQEVQLWDLTGRSLLRQALQADPQFISCVAFSPDGKHLATVGLTGIAKIWDVTSGKQVCSFKGPSWGSRQFLSVAFHPTGKYVASGGSDRKVNLWNPATGHEIHPALSEHTDGVRGIAFSPDGKYLATSSLREVIVWDVTDLENINQVQKFDRLAGRIWWVAFSPDGKRLAAASGYKGKGEIKIWDSTLWDQSVVRSKNQ
jgi:WD40 repeat protein